MELFSVKRYTEEAAPAPEKEAERLVNLLKKIEKRKRGKQAAITNAITEEPVEKRSTRVEAELEPGQDDDDDPITADIEDVVAESQSVASGQFEVLGDDDDFKKRQKIDMILPPWLAHPTIISTNITAPTDEEQERLSEVSYLTRPTCTALAELSVKRLFPVQTAVIPWILEAHMRPPPFRPRDICVSAPTGSGKTLAFAIPIVQLLTPRMVPKIRALVVLPVGELALQVYKVFKKLCDKTSLKVCLLSKQFHIAQEQEKLIELYKGEYHSKVDIVVTTPGRFVDHLHATPGFCLKALKFLVIDEADRIMDAVFQNWMYHIDEQVRSTSDQLLSGRAAPLCYNELQRSWGQPHRLLFSATLSQDPEKLQNLRLFQPKLFTSVLHLDLLRDKWTQIEEAQPLQPRGEFIGKYTTPAELTEKYCLTESRLKPLTLYALIHEQRWTKFLCFTNSIEAAGRLAFVLAELLKKQNSEQPLAIAELSASLNAKERANVLNKFSRGKLNGLICSDALARGIDIPEVDVVVSYDVARHLKTHIHRIGRTARAGRPGSAITLLTQHELTRFNQILATVGKSLNVELTVSSAMEEEYASAYKQALSSLRAKLEKNKRTALLQKERAKANKLMPQKPTEQLTLMEKLQVQVNEQTLNAVPRDAKKTAKKPTHKFTRTKIKPSAGKNQELTC